MKGQWGGGRARTSAVAGVVVLLGAIFGLAGAAQAGQLSLSWTAPVTNADGSRLTDLAGYRIYIGTSTPACPGSSFHAVPSSTSTPSSNQTVSATITGLNAGTTYAVRVSAVDRSGNEGSCSAATTGVARGALSVSPTGTVSFGSVQTGVAVDRTFAVKNTTSATVSGSATVGAPFSIVSGGSFSLAGGATQNVVVRFRSTTVGSFAGNVTFRGGGDTLTRGVSGSTTGSTTSPPSGTPTLTVSRAGSGSGTVTSSPSGISCGSDCTQTYTAGTRVTLTASPASGSRFAGWSGGGCSGTGTCSVTLSGSTGVTATFDTTGSTSSLPDLAVASLSVPSTVNRGASYTMSFNVVNQGSAAAGTSQVRVYVSRDGRLSSDDTTAWSRTLSSVAARGSVSSSITSSVPSSTPPGTYYVLVVVDSSGQVRESNESNNTVTRTLTVR